MKRPRFLNIVRTIKKPAFLAALIFFAALLLIGLTIYPDYGISWDEYNQLEIGKANYRFLTKGITDLFEMRDARYGPLFEIFLVRVMDQSTPRAMYLSRHLWTFVSFYMGVGAFYFLARKAFRSDWLALLGCGLLALCPRIFADAFYNSKDIPFLSAAIFSAASLFWYLEKPGWLRMSLHALFTAALIAIRAPGIYMPGITLGMLLIEVFTRRMKPLHGLKVFFIYLVLTAGLTFAFFPYLWLDPLASAREVLMTMANFPHYLPVLYLGEQISPNALPWHYIPVWIGISLPITYLALSLLGLAVVVFEGLGNLPALFGVNARIRILALAWLFGPLLVVDLRRSSLYDAWRQMFFIYPALVLLAVEGAAWISSTLRLQMKAVPVTALLVAGSLALFLPVIARMVDLHPYQNLYFNRLAGPDMQTVKSRFDLDYWGLSYREGLAYILASDPSDSIPVYADTDAGWRNGAILGAEGEARLRFVNDPEDAEYYLGSYRWHPQDYPYLNEVYSVMVGNAKIMTVFKLK